VRYIDYQLLVRAVGRDAPDFSPLILVDGPVGLVVLEGHARLRAYALEPTAIPVELDVLVGSSPTTSEWALY